MNNWAYGKYSNSRFRNFYMYHLYEVKDIEKAYKLENIAVNRKYAEHLVLSSLKLEP